MKAHSVAAQTVHDAIIMAVTLAENEKRDVEPSSFQYMGKEGGQHILWFVSYPSEDTLEDKRGT